MQGSLVKSPQSFGEVKEGLYLLDTNSPKSMSIFNKNVFSFLKGSNSNQESSSVSISIYVNATPDVKLWHVSLGHLHFQQ